MRNRERKRKEREKKCEIKKNPFATSKERAKKKRGPKTSSFTSVGGSNPNTLIAPSIIRSGVRPILSSCCGVSGALPLHRSLSRDFRCLASFAVAADAPPPFPTIIPEEEEEEEPGGSPGENGAPHPGQS